MKTVYITRGLPGAGKDYWAKSLIDKHPNQYKRVTKDILRELLDNGKWSKDNEKLVLKVRDAIILEAINHGKHVIVSDTNFEERHIEHIRELVKGKANVEIKDFTDVPLEVCIVRDAKRENPVGEKVIRGMYNKYLKPKVDPVEYDPKLPDAIICDLDGTLCLMNGRNPYDASTCEEDSLNFPVGFVLDRCKSSHDIILLSGREDKYKPQTLRWLEKHGIKYNMLNMRKSGDNRKDSIIKQELYEEHIKGKYNISFVMDDRDQVVSLWRSLGLTCFQVAEGDF